MLPTVTAQIKRDGDLSDDELMMVLRKNSRHLHGNGAFPFRVPREGSEVRSSEDVAHFADAPQFQNGSFLMAYNSDFGTFCRYRETALDKMLPEMKDGYDFTMNHRAQLLHKIRLANSRLSKTIVPTEIYYQRQPTLAKAKIEIVTNIFITWFTAVSLTPIAFAIPSNAVGLDQAI